MLNEKPSEKVLRFAEYEGDRRFLRIEDCKVGERNIKSVMYAMYSMSGQIEGLSMSDNKYFNDECLRQLVDIIGDLKYLKVLQLSKVNASEQAFTRIAEILPYQMPLLKELDLSSNAMNFFTFDYL